MIEVFAIVIYVAIKNLPENALTFAYFPTEF